MNTYLYCLSWYRRLIRRCALIFSTVRLNRELAAEMAAKLDMQTARASLKRFADGEVRGRTVVGHIMFGLITFAPHISPQVSVTIHDSVRDKEIFIVQSTAPPVNDNIMELVLMVSALRRASVYRELCFLKFQPHV
jgi:phosphoribosylpyrophosphate synthetase